ncbi:hypothetical protein Tco_0944625 [Tanacetum coccineum]
MNPISYPTLCNNSDLYPARIKERSITCVSSMDLAEHVWFCRLFGVSGKTRALEQETHDLDVEIQQMKDLKASYGITTPQELRRNQD